MSKKVNKASPAKGTTKSSKSNPVKGVNVDEAEVHLNEITSELRHKQRLVAAINNNTSNVDERFKSELASRDKHIDELNRRILDLEQLCKNKKQSTKDVDHEKVYKDINDLLVDNHNLQNRCLFFETQLNSEKEKTVKANEEGELLQEALNEEVEDLKKQGTLKDQQHEDTKQDMVHLSKIVQDMTGLNNELNEKVASLNEELERLNEENFSAKKKAEHVDDLEKNIAEQGDENTNLLRQTKKQNALVEYLKGEKSSGETCFTENKTRMGEIEEKLNEMAEKVKADGSESLAPLVQGLADMGKAIQDVKTSFEAALCRPLPSDVAENTVNIKDELNGVKHDITEKEKKIRRLTKESKILTDRNQELELLMKQNKTDDADTVRRNKVRLDRLSDENERLKKKCQALTENLSKKELAHNKSETTNAMLQSRNDGFKKKNDELANRATGLESVNKDVRAAMLKLQTEKTQREREFQAKDTRVRKAASLIKAYEDEIFTRDSEILKKESNIGKLQTQLEEVKRNNGKLNTKLKTIVAEELDSANRMLADKDNEIKILKEMVRSTQTQMKTIEKDAFTLKKRMEGPEIKKPKKAKKAPDSPLIKQTIAYIKEIKDIDRWIANKRAKFTTIYLDAAEIKAILGVEIKGEGEQNVSEAIEEVRKEMTQTVFDTTKVKMQKSSDKVNVKKLQKRANFERLNTMLSDHNGETMTADELVSILERL